MTEPAGASRPALHEIERVCSYITDDGYIASYFGVSREEIARVRQSLNRPTQRYRRFSGNAYLSHGENAGLDKLAKDIRAAEDASNALRNECMALFERFERAHRLPQGYGKKFQLGGYRS